MSSAEKGAKLEKKLALHLGGYRQRSEAIRKQIAEKVEALNKARNALVGFSTLAASEQEAIKRRLPALRDEVAFVSRREREAQELYRRNKEELDALTDGRNGYHGVVLLYIPN
jgi:pre-mRNA-splicing factor CDC5/CEF1